MKTIYSITIVAIALGLSACGGDSKPVDLGLGGTGSTSGDIAKTQSELVGTWVTACLKSEGGLYERTKLRFSKTKKFYSLFMQYEKEDCSDAGGNAAEISGSYVVSSYIKDNQYALDVTLDPAADAKEGEAPTVVLTSFILDGTALYVAKEEENLKVRGTNIDKNSAAHRYSRE